MAFNIAVPSAFISESESYEWFGSTGIALKDIKTSFFKTTDPSGWVNISDFVKTIRINGSVNNLSGEPGANTAFVELDNYDKRFTDINTTGAYYGNINPNQQIKIDLSIGSTCTIIFSGRVSQGGWVEEREGHQGVVTIDVMDGAYDFMRKKFDKNYYYKDRKLVDEDDAGNSLLHILLQNHASIASTDIVCNGAVPITVPFSVFKEGDSIQDHIRELAKACLVQYAGFRYDGKYVFESRLVDGWSEPSSEYVLTTESYQVNLTKEIIPLIGNNVKVRGVNDFTREGTLLWDLTTIKQINTNASFPYDCYETVTTGQFYLGTPTVPFYAEYTTIFGELLNASSVVMSIKCRTAIGYPHWDGQWIKTTGSDLDFEPTKGKLVLQSSSLFNVYIMQILIKATATIRHKFSHKDYVPPSVRGIWEYPVPDYTGGVGGAVGTGGSWTGGDEEWGRIGVQSNPTSISAYGQTDYVLSSEYIVCNTQLDNILQWHLLNGQDPKHLFVMNHLPFLSFVQPGAPIWLNLTDVGFSGMATITAYEHNITPDGADSTLTILENPGDWLLSTGAAIREIYASPGKGNSAGEIGAAAWMGNTKYVIATAGCDLPADVFCDGTSDESEWNDAIQFVSERGGGTIVGIGSVFNTTAALSLESNIAIELDNGTSIKKNGDFNAIEALGTATTLMENIAIIGKGTITRDAADTNAKDLIYFDYVEDFDLRNIIIDSSYDDGIYLQNCLNGRIGEGMKIYGCLGTGVKHIASRVIIASALTILSCGIGCECLPSNGTDKITHGNCESTSSPITTGEVDPYLDKCTWARNNDITAYDGSYVYKATLTSTYCSVGFTDNIDFGDLHGMTPGKSYYLRYRLYIPTAGGITASHINTFITVRDYGLTNVPAALYDQWQTVNMLITLGAAEDTFNIVIYVYSESDGDYLYVDDISLYEFDEVSGGCQIVNSSITECGDGIDVADSQVIIQNNQITDCLSVGINILCGYRNLIMGNRCYNNGDDIGLSNENQHNFYDAGIDTQLG